MKTRYGFLVMTTALLLAACDGNGPEGGRGNASVQAFPIDFLLEDMFVDDASGVASAAYDVPAVTPSVVDHGAVLAFFRAQGTWTALPFTYAYESDRLDAVDHTIEFGYGYEYDGGGFVEFFYEPSIPGVDATKPGAQEVKVVVIDSLPLSKAGLDLSDYDAVMEYFGLE